MKTVVLTLAALTLAAPVFAQTYRAPSQAELDAISKATGRPARAAPSAPPAPVARQGENFIVAQRVRGETVYRVLTPEQFSEMTTRMVMLGELEPDEVAPFVATARQESRKNAEALRRQEEQNALWDREDRSREQYDRDAAADQRARDYLANGLTVDQINAREDRIAIENNRQRAEAQDRVDRERASQAAYDAQRVRDEQAAEAERRRAGRMRDLDQEFADLRASSARTLNNSSPAARPVAAPAAPTGINSLSAIDRERYQAILNGSYLLREGNSIRILTRQQLETEISRQPSRPIYSLSDITGDGVEDLRKKAERDTAEIRREIESRMRR